MKQADSNTIQPNEANLDWSGRWSESQSPHSIRCVAYVGRNTAMLKTSCTCGSLATFVESLSAEVTELKAEVDRLKAALEQIVALVGVGQPGSSQYPMGTIWSIARQALSEK